MSAATSSGKNQEGKRVCVRCVCLRVSAKENAYFIDVNLLLKKGKEKGEL